jgi:hypothetical protein
MLTRDNVDGEVFGKKKINNFIINFKEINE